MYRNSLIRSVDPPDIRSAERGPQTSINSFQRTLTRGGFGPLNSKRWRGASRRPNGQGVNCTPGVRRGAGQPVVQADGRLLESHAGRAPSIKRRSLRSPSGMVEVPRL